MRMRVTENMINGLEIVHGGVLFTLADAAFAYACNAYDRVALAQACNIDYVRPAKLGDELTAEAVERNRSRTSGLYDVTVSRSDGKWLPTSGVNRRISNSHSWSLGSKSG